MPDLGGAGLFGDLVVISQSGLNSLSIPSSENFFEFEYRVKYFNEISEEQGKQNLKGIFSSESIQMD